MKKKVVAVLMGICVMTTMSAGSVTTFAAEATETDVENEDATATETEQEPQDITFLSGETEIVIQNDAEIVFTNVEFVKAEKAEADLENEADTKAAAAADETSAEEEECWNLVLTKEDESVSTFENVTPEEWTEPTIAEEFGFLYITYKDENGDEQECIETADEKELEEAVTVYALADVNVRKEASKEGEVLKVSSLGAEWKAVAAVPGWVKVESGEISGYISHKYVTDDKAVLEEKIKENNEKSAAQTASNTQSSYQEDNDSSSYSTSSENDSSNTYAEPEAPQQTAEPETSQEVEAQPETPQERYEVSRQAYDNCDGSGHGYYEITYSDGSVEYQEY